MFRIFQVLADLLHVNSSLRPGQNWVMVSGRARDFYELELQSLRAPWKYGVTYIHSKIIFFCRLQFEFQVCVALERLCSWDVPNIAGWTSSVLPFNRAFPWAFSLTNVLRNSFILVFIHRSFNHTEQKLRIQRRKRRGRPFAEGLGVSGRVPGPRPFHCTWNLSRFLWTIECIRWFQIVCSYKLYC